MQQDVVIKRERTLSPKPTGIDENLKPNLIIVTRERRSLSPLSISQISERQKEETRATTNNLSPAPSSILKRQTAIVNESVVSSSSSPRLQETEEDDYNALHGSSEFMLVLYPDDEKQEKDDIGIMSGAEFRDRGGSKFKFFLTTWIIKN